MYEIRVAVGDSVRHLWLTALMYECEAFYD